MRFKLLGLMAALLIVAGCETPPEETTTTETATTEAMPAPAPMQKMSAQEDLVINVGDRVFFDFDKSDLRPDAIDTLNRQSDWMKTNGSVTVAIEGHCDERGTREYNLALGERRASSAKQYLESMGVSGGRMETVSYGKERPAVLGSNEAAWAQNRRAVLVVKSGELS
jgi:peptidoglycan-associated lipoprotein